MGVGRENKDIFFGPYVQENEMQILEQSGQSGQSTDEEDVPPSARNHAHQSSPRRRYRPRPRSSSLEACLTGMYRRCGSRQARRTEHIKQLLNMKMDGEESSDVLTPTYSSSSSPFSQLFQERNKMQAWNNFINSSEEDQERILEMRRSAPSLSSIREESDEEDERNGNVKDSLCSTEDNDNGNLDDSWEKVDLPSEDKRAVHPSFSAAECFQRVDKNLRSLLTRRHLPLGLVSQLEREVVEFFTDCPGSVYVSHLSSSFERLLLHAVCQYLGLTCRSFEEGGERRTHVENKQPTFLLPSQSLVQYLQRS